jgi:hypothetical protein
MPQSPIYSLTGDASFVGSSVTFQVEFQNEDDQPLVQAYEWYLDSILVINANSQNFAAEVGCGNHIISCRALYQDTWTGTEELAFEACRAIISINITGPDQVALNNSVTYTVICEFSDGTTADVTDQYTFSSSAGGTFEGNIFTATGGSSLTPPFDVTITATPHDGTPLTKPITVIDTDTTSMGILVVDLYNDSTLNVIGLIDNAEVTESHQPAYTGNNFIPTGSEAASALILASDFINQSVLNWRFEFNLRKLNLQYPGTDQFRIFIMGRGAVATTLNGAYVVFNPQGTMTMSNSPGTYQPSVSGGTQVVSQTDFTVNVVDGADGSYNEADLSLIIKFIYTVSANTITYTI